MRRKTHIVILIFVLVVITFTKNATACQVVFKTSSQLEIKPVQNLDNISFITNQITPKQIDNLQVIGTLSASFITKLSVMLVIAIFAMMNFMKWLSRKKINERQQED